MITGTHVRLSILLVAENSINHSILYNKGLLLYIRDRILLRRFDGFKYLSKQISETAL